MLADPTVLGIDLGTSSVKVVLTDTAGAIRATASADYPVSRPCPGWAETDPELWWQAVCACTRKVLTDAGVRNPAGIGLSGQMHGVVLVDAAGGPVRPAVLWADARATQQMSALAALTPAARARLANPLSPGMAGPILGWLHVHEPDAVAASRWALQPKDWIRARLTGRFAAEPSDASATLLFDVITQDWSDAATAALGIRRDLLPDVLPFSGTPAGTLQPVPAADLGLAAGIAVAAGAADSAAAALGSGLFDIGATQLTIGTGVQIFTPVPTPTATSIQADTDPVTHLYRAATRDGWYAMAAGLTGGQSLNWVRTVLGATWDELYASAARPARLDDPIFLPHLIGERTPYLDTRMRGSWIGLSASHDRGNLLYAALEGVAFAVADSLDALPGIPDKVHTLRLAGGGTTFPAWRQLLADTLDADLHAVAVPGASARGAALLAGQAAGLIDDIALSQVATPAMTLVATPSTACTDLAHRRRRYLRALNALRPTRRSPPMPAETRDLTDTVVLVTGAGAGIGAATATLLLEAGANVVLADFNPDAAAALAARWPTEQVLVTSMNVRAPGEAHAAVAAAVHRWGRLDSLVCNAGIGVFGSILDYTDEQLTAIVDTNLLGTIWAVRAATPHFTRQGGGDIVIVASVAGLGSASGQESVYASSKYGQVGLAVSLDRELRPRGIRVSTIAPAAVNTGFADGVGRTAGDPLKDSYLAPTDVAAAITIVLAQPRRMRTALWTLWSMSENS